MHCAYYLSFYLVNLFFQANWGDHLGVVLLILLTEVLLATSFGLGIGYITKTGEASRAIILVIVQLASIFGGAYFVVEENFVTNLSPLTWANTAVMKIIYANDVGGGTTSHLFKYRNLSTLFIHIDYRITQTGGAIV